MLMEPKNYAISTKELILKQAKHKGGTETFVYEPSNIEEEPLGNLYIIGWMKNGEPAEILFESALKKANAALSDIAASTANMGDVLGLCVINIAGEKVRFAQTSP